MDRQLIQKREEKRWLPSKNFVYAKLVDISGKAFSFSLPSPFLKNSQTVFYFGDVTAFPRFEIGESNRGFDILEFQQTELKIYTSLEIFRKIDRLTELLEQLNNIFSQSAYLIEPELLALLLESRTNLESIISSKGIVPSNHDIDDTTALLLAHELMAITSSFDNVLKWLEQKSSKKETYQEFEQKIFGTSQGTSKH